METKTLEVSNLSDIVLTNEGKVVGYIKIRHEIDYIHFVGSAVNLQDFKSYKFTHNIFGATGAMTCDSSTELSTSENFINALKVAN